MSKILNTTVDEVRIGQRIPVGDRFGRMHRYDMVIQAKMEIHVCPHCGHTVGKDYLNELPFCLDCLDNYEEKTLVRFQGDEQ